MGADKKQSQVIGSKRGQLIQKLFGVFFCLLACGLFYYFFVNSSFVEMELGVSQKTEFKIYWAAPGKAYSERHMSVVTVTPDRNNYSLFLTNIGKVERLRIDTHSYVGEVILKKLLLRQEGWQEISLSTPEELDKLVVLNHIGDSRIDSEGLWVQSTGNDPYFELTISPVYTGINYAWLAVRLIGIGSFMLLLLLGGRRLVEEWRFVPLLLFGIWLVIIVMAGISDRNVHPDEYVHMHATEYYQDTWLPPDLEDPKIRDTYSVYGYSRLNSGEVFYLFNGKFLNFLQPFQLPAPLSLRMMNLLLFGLIVLYTVGNTYARMVALPFLVSPQLWYAFSYCGSDAFSLFFAFLLGCQLIDPDSLLHRYLHADKLTDKLAGLVCLSALFAMMFLLKKNFYPFIAFFYFCLGMKLFFVQEFFWVKKEAIVRLLIISMLGGALFGLRVGADYMVNGIDRKVKMEVLREEMARSQYKPSTELEKKHPALNLKARGTSLEKLVVRDRWFERSFQSSFGVFGYFDISASKTYYDLIRWTGAALLLFFLGSVIIRGGLIGSGLTVVILGFSAALIGASLYHSWTVDFQPQGRYLFPIFPMLGILYGWKHEVVNKQVLILGVTSMYLLAMYCFIFEALLKIPKVVY